MRQIIGREWPNRSFGRVILLLIGIITIFLFFKNILSAVSEAFYMSVPICWLMYLFLFDKERFRGISRIKNVISALWHLLITVLFFWYLSVLIGGKIIWEEVLLAIYFLCSVGIIVNYLRNLIFLIARRISSVVKHDKIKKAICLLLVTILWSFTILPYLMATFSVHRPKIGDKMTPLVEYNYPYEDISLKTKDNVLLRGWYVPQPNSKKSVVIGHGLGANKSNFINLVQIWHDLGYAVLIFDFRGHGQSQGHTLSFGYKERLDIEAAVDYLSKRKELDPNEIIGYGVSFGGAALIQAAAEDRRIKLVVIDSSFADIRTMARKVVDRMMLIPPFIRETLTKIGLGVINLELGFNINTHLPKDAIAKFTKQPVLIIHGKNDVLIPWTESKELYANAQEPKELYLIDSGGHYTTLLDPEYINKISNFIKTMNSDH